VGGPLGVEEPVGVPPGQQGEHDLGEQDRLQVRLGLLGFGQPAFEVGDAPFGDGVALPLGPLARLCAHHDRPTVAPEASERGVHLAERERLVAAEALIEGLFELVAVRRTTLEQAEKREGGAHVRHYTQRVCTRLIVAPER
jgi:hypothetical protein